MFNDAWDCAPGCFERLHSFYDGLATVLANTTSVKSAFSILNWEMDVNRMTLMHLSLEGIFQAK
jgi:GTP1/Obg family GTP-binding protein